MRQQVPHRHGRSHRTRLETLFRVDRDAQRLPFRNQLGDRLIEAKLAILDQRHDGNAGDDLVVENIR